MRRKGKYYDLIWQDKAIKRYQSRNMVDGSSLKDIKENSAYERKSVSCSITLETQDFYMPKLYVKLQYCVSCAIHARIVR